MDRRLHSPVGSATYEHTRLARRIGVPLLGNTLTSGSLYKNNQNKINGQGYDRAGHQISVSGLTVSYDAENHQTVAWEPPALGGGRCRHRSSCMITYGNGLRLN